MAPLRRVIAFTAIILLAGLFTAPAQRLGDLLVTPTRVVFEGAMQMQALTLINIGQDTASYDISIVRYRMSDNGEFEVIQKPDPGQLLADDLIRFFPKSVKLAPRESQNVRMQLKPGIAAPDGEYRTHVYFRAVDKGTPLASDTTAADTTALAIKLTAVYGVSIPVIVRRGNLTASVTLSDIAIIDKKDSVTTKALHFTANRTGTRSVYGDFTVDYAPPTGDKVQVGSLKGISVYTPNALRKVTIPLRLPKELALKGGRLIIRYIARSELEKESTIAEQEFPVP